VNAAAALFTLIAATLAISAAAIQPHPPPQPPGEPTFRTRTSGVRIDVLVTAGEVPVPNLTPADFELTDSGVAQQVEVTSLRDLPLDVIIVLDTSHSLGDDGLRHLLRATDTLLGNLRTSDRAGLVTFSRAVMMRSALTSERDRVRAMLSGLKAEGTTSVIDAVYTATTLRTQIDQSDQKEQKEQKEQNEQNERNEQKDRLDRSALLLVFSDGIDTASWLRPEKVLETVRRSAVVPYAVVVGEAARAAATPAPAPTSDSRNSRASREPIDATDSFLHDLVATGGGLVLPAADTNQVERRFAEALDNFRQRYVLTYTPRGVDSSGWHPVTVKVKGGHRVRARPGYFVQ
jgi:VWFA-related protein